MSHASGGPTDRGGGPSHAPPLASPAPPPGHAHRPGDRRPSRDRPAGGGRLAEVGAPGESGGGAALQRAAASGRDDVVGRLLAAGADVNGQDHVHGNTAQHEASWKGYSRTVRLLASAGADLDRRNVAGFTALHLSCQNGHNQSCRELLLAGCNPDVQNSYGDTALHTAARYGHAGVTRILISGQCRVSEQNKNGDTALHVAAAMGRRKLTRILREAGCDARVRNKQAETARDIALRKGLAEILDILDDGAVKRAKGKKKAKGRVKFEKEVGKDAAVAGLEETKPWSPYGCHYFPDTKNFPSPRLDSLPTEPLKKGEQYYLDLAGNICKGPIGVGYTCYCAPLFRHLEARVERDKKELQRAHFRLRQRVIGLEQKLKRGQPGRRSERVVSTAQRVGEGGPARSRSLEMLYRMDEPPLQATRSMDELEQPADHPEAAPRPSVRELVARIQHLHASAPNGDGNSESSDDEDTPQRRRQPPHHDAAAPPTEADLPPRSRSGVYSPTAAPDLEPYKYYDGAAAAGDGVVSTGFAERRVLTGVYASGAGPYANGAGQYGSGAGPSGVGGAYAASAHDQVDRDTNNDSGYSTKVYGSSKGNSPSLCGGKTDVDGGLGASSLV